MSRSVWEDIYHRYRMLSHAWRCQGAPKEIEQQAFTTVLTSPKEPQLCLKELRRWGYGGPRSKHWEEALELRGAIQVLPEGWFPDEPLADVYQAALRMETFEPWHGNQGKRRIYRGQRNHLWPVVPKMFRGKTSPVVRAGSIESDFKEELDGICGYVRFLQAKGQDITEEEGVAIVQHYSSEIKMGTWLIDFTWDPFVALFFASDGGQVDDIGKILYLGIGEWNRFSAGGTNRLGSVRLIEPKGVPRIDAQHALFIDTSHPDLFEQFVPHSLYFRQIPGFVFEDETREPPVARAVLYPENDAYKEELLSAHPLPPAQPLEYLPASDASVPLGAEDYLDIVESWYRYEGLELRATDRQVLRQVCLVYAGMQAANARPYIELTVRSLHRLEEARLNVQKLGASGLDDALEFLVNRPMDSSSKEVIADLIRKVKEGAIYLSRPGEGEQ